MAKPFTTHSNPMVLTVITDGDVDRYERLHLSTELTKQDVEHICTVHKCSTDGCACRDFRSESDCIMSFALGIREGTIHPRVMETPEGAPHGKPRRKRGAITRLMHAWILWSRDW